MILRYEIWDTESANQVAAFKSRDEAFEMVAEYRCLNGADAVSSLVVGAIHRDEAGAVRMIPVVDGCGTESDG